jgi:hypothetical protein
LILEKHFLQGLEELETKLEGNKDVKNSYESKGAIPIHSSRKIILKCRREVIN